MLRCTQTILGRWGSRDFLRGRSKRAGAVHTRHTHGRCGRYKRLSSLYSSIRDGRRHVGNHMQGGLGIKLGGGLFGLRIPRQHQLSHMTKEQFDLEVYGHPNITNPYREHLDEHPDLKSVMMNASMTVKMVVLLPRVSRNHSANNSSSSGGASSSLSVVPAKWGSVVREVSAALELLAPGSGPTDGSSTSSVAASPTVEVHFTTLETSVCCHWPAKGSRFSSSASASPVEFDKPLSFADHASQCVAQLYCAHCKLGQTLRLEKTSGTCGSTLTTTSSFPHQGPHTLAFAAARRRKRPVVFMGAALRAPATNTTNSSTATASSPSVGASPTPSKSLTSAVLAQLTETASGTLKYSIELAEDRGAKADTSRVCTQHGLVDIVHRLSATEQPLLRVCIRPSMIGSGAATMTSASSSENTARRVLKADIDVNAEVGVWKLPKSSLHALLRWHYCAQDPRAHNHDALPHHRRTLPLLMVVDYSTASDVSPSELRRKTASTVNRHDRLNTTLMPRRLSMELESAGFKMVKEASLQGVAAAIAEWSPSAQWERFAQLSVSPAAPVEGENNHRAACA